MEIHQLGGTEISGSYFLDNGDKGVIDGWRDGISFGASFTRGDSVTKWIVEHADIATSEGYLELKGNSYLARAQGNNWIRIQPDTHFYATAIENP